MYHIICVGGGTQMLTYAGSSVTGCASQHLSRLYSTFNFVSHFGADVAAELEQLPADRRIGCSVHRGCIFTFRYSWKTFREPPVSQCVLAFPLIANLLRREEASAPSCWCLDDCVGPFHETRNSETYITAKNLTHCTRRLSSLSLRSFVYLTQARTDKAHFNHGETWQQMSASILNLNKWKWLICHSSFQGGIFCSPPPHTQGRDELNLARGRVSCCSQRDGQVPGENIFSLR